MEKSKILLVDDQPENIMLLRSIINNTESRHDIFEAQTAQEALRVAQMVLPDIIITDWKMPETNGLELIQKLKEIPETRDIPVAICTGKMTSSANVQSALSSGAMEYIRKPFDPIEIKVRLKSMLLLSRSMKIIKEQNKQLVIQKEELALEKDKSERLLFNILPRWVIQDLKKGNSAKSRVHENVSILFTDFVGFTQLAEEQSPEELVSLLDYFFKQFDTITKSLGLEKIKTIGDAYMCAGGLDNGHIESTHNTLAAGLSMLKFMNETNVSREASGQKRWDIRIGINTGTVVSGIVGRDKFAYDLWGDPVNVAARVETLGAVNRVSVSETTFNMSNDFFDFELAGEFNAKNKGLMKIYSVVDHKSH